MRSDIGAEIKRLRVAKGFSQDEVGERMGWGGENIGQTISHYENGRRGVGLDNAVALFRILGGSLDRFFGLTDPPERRSGKDRRAPAGESVEMGLRDLNDPNNLSDWMRDHYQCEYDARKGTWEKVTEDEIVDASVQAAVESWFALHDALDAEALTFIDSP